MVPINSMLSSEKEQGRSHPMRSVSQCDNQISAYVPDALKARKVENMSADNGFLFSISRAGNISEFMETSKLNKHYGEGDIERNRRPVRRRRLRSEVED